MEASGCRDLIDTEDEAGLLRAEQQAVLGRVLPKFLAALRGFQKVVLHQPVCVGFFPKTGGGAVNQAL